MAASSYFDLFALLNLRSVVFSFLYKLYHYLQIDTMLQVAIAHKKAVPAIAGLLYQNSDRYQFTEPIPDIDLFF